jgi:hypothetical protein
MKHFFNTLLLMFALFLSVNVLAQKRSINYTLDGTQYSAAVEVNFWLDQNKSGSGDMVLTPMLDLNQYRNAQIIIEIKNLEFEVAEHAAFIIAQPPNLNFSSFKGIKSGKRFLGDDGKSLYYVLEIDYQPFDGPVEGRFSFVLNLVNTAADGAVVGTYKINRDYVFIPSPREVAKPAPREIVTTRTPREPEPEKEAEIVEETRPTPPPSPSRLQEEARAWENARNGSIADLQNFVSRYPNSEHAANARTRIQQAEDRDWASATRDDNEQSYRRYLDKYPNGRFVNLALNKIRSMETQVDEVSVAWDQTKLEGTVEAYAGFLSDYPGSEFEAEATEKLTFLTEERAARELAGIAPLEAEFTTIADTLFVRNMRGGQPPYFLEFRNRDREFITKPIPLPVNVRDTVINTMDLGLEDGFYTIRIGDARRIDWSPSFIMPIRTMRLAGSSANTLIWIVVAMSITALITIAGFKFYLYKKRKDEEDDFY